MSTLTDQVNFGIIRYANCWEDADVLLDALALIPGANILCIASAGDNALSLLTTAPAKVHAIDLSLPQLYLTELKQVAFSRLEYHEVLELLGVHSTANSLKLYEQIKQHLSAGAKSYWDEHTDIFHKGLIRAGKFEHYFALFRKYMLPLVHSKRTGQQLLAHKTKTEQETVYHKEWNTWRWKLLMNIFFSRRVMGKYGRDPQFLKHVNVPVSQYIRQKAEQHLQSVYCQSNYMLQMIFTGSFGNILPHYLREENFRLIKQHIGSLTITQADADTAVRQQLYDAYCFSNIFEYMSQKDFEHLVNVWGTYMLPGAKLTYWNLMVPRSFSELSPGVFKKTADSNKYADIDRGFFYSRFLTEQKI